MEYEFEINGFFYEYNQNKGICRQLFPDPMAYNETYINERHNNYGEWGPRMALFRLGYLLGTLDHVPKSLLDVGYGNGDFLKACAKIIPNVAGLDIPPVYPIDPIRTIDNIYQELFEVVCFFDSLEHFVDPYEIKALDAEYVFISLPQLHPQLGVEWFMNWRHYKPNEHLWYFSDQGLVTFFKEIGYELIKLSNFEDTIRAYPEQKEPNILAGFFKKNHGKN